MKNDRISVVFVISAPPLPDPLPRFAAEREFAASLKRCFFVNGTIPFNAENQLREPFLRVCCQHELATGRFAGDCGFGRRIVFVGTVSPAQIQF
ncbi:MAG: hypothetical protein ACLQU6_18650 [Limisphaerales bacterium]